MAFHRLYECGVSGQNRFELFPNGRKFHSGNREGAGFRRGLAELWKSLFDPRLSELLNGCWGITRIVVVCVGVDLRSHFAQVKRQSHPGPAAKNQIDSHEEAYHPKT